jgi:cyclopropane fatty-acyl-phospholipid synthase-like methyltransferase
LEKNPTWHVDDSPWKADNIYKMLRRNKIAPMSVCEVGCGAGEVLKQLQSRLNRECEFWGYEISPQAFELAKQRANKKLHFKLEDFLKEKDVFFDVILLIDLIEHLEDYFSFLRQLKMKSQYKLLHIPLDLSAQSVLRKNRLMKARLSTGHIHYFTKEIAVQSLVDLGYEVVDYFYTASAIDLRAQSYLAELAKIPRRFLFALNPDLASRMLGGYSLMVLAK